MEIARHYFPLAVACALGAVALIGCDGGSGEHQHDGNEHAVSDGTGLDNSSDSGEERLASGENHAHSAPHGGMVKTVGSNHAELVLGDEGSLILYVLAGAESEPFPISTQVLTVQVRASGDESFSAVSLHAAPAPTDPDGKISRFQGTLPSDLHGKELSITITIPIEGKSYRAQFNVKGEVHEGNGGHEAQEAHQH